MKFETLPLFDKQFKKLAKKYNHIRDDIQIFVNDFKDIHRQSTSIKNNIYKVRLSNSDKNRGKSSGYRVYYYTKVEDVVYLVTIYDKSDIQMIDEKIVFNVVKDVKL